MSTIALRVTEVEARLHLLRRRINAFRAQHVAYLGASGIVAILAILVIAGLQAPPEIFRVAMWLSAVLILVVVGISLLLVSARWIDDVHAARLADRQGGLADRLTTLISLRARPQPSRLQPVLIAQTLDLGDRWRPEHIAPRRVPRSILVLFASLLLLASTALIQKRGIDVTGLGSEKQDAFDFERDAPARLPNPHQPRTRGDQPGDRLEGPGQQNPQESAGGATPFDGLPQAGTYDGSAPLEGTQLSQLPDRLQDAIRRAFDAEPVDSLRRLGSGAEKADSGRPGGGREGGVGNEEKEGTAEPGTGQRETHGEASRPSTREPRESHDQRGGGQKVGQRRDTKHGKPGELSGSSPGAGDGPGSIPPIGVEADLAGGIAAAPFKLTITSFLAAVERQGLPQWKPGTGSPTSSGAGEATTGGLSDRQLNDDALRKAEIPAEYEDVVRRAYSAGK